jgi:hypothetical protein
MCSSCAQDCGCCGAPSAEQFSIVIRRTLIAPFDFEDMQWDFDGNFQSWYDEYGLFIELAAKIGSKGVYQWGTIRKAVELYTSIGGEALFHEFVAPDALIELYLQPSQISAWQHLGGWYELPVNTHLIGGLNAGVLEFGPTTRVELHYFDRDLVFDDRIGEISITRDLARAIADCGPVGLTLTPEDMNAFNTRIHAIELELTSVP